MNCYSVFLSFFKSTKPQVKVDWAADRPLVHLIPVLTARENSRKSPDGQSDSPALPVLVQDRCWGHWSMEEEHPWRAKGKKG